MGEVIQFPSQGELALGVRLKTQKQPMTAAPPRPAPPVQAPSPYIRPTRSQNCFACGKNRRAHNSRYCQDCTSAGLDSPIISCAHNGCTTVTKRRYVGQQFFWCPAHDPKRTT